MKCHQTMQSWGLTFEPGSPWSCGLRCEPAHNGLEATLSLLLWHLSLSMLPTEARLIISNLRLYQVITPFRAPGNFYPAGASSQSKCHKGLQNVLMTCSLCQASWGCIQLLAQEWCMKQFYSLSRQLSFSKGCASPHKPASLRSSMVLQSLVSHPVHLSHGARFLYKAEPFHRAGPSTPHSFSA